jgi:hypothetical protein
MTMMVLEACLMGVEYDHNLKECVFSTLFSNFKIIIPYQAVEYNCIFCVAAGARRP